LKKYKNKIKEPYALATYIAKKSRKKTKRRSKQNPMARRKKKKKSRKRYGNAGKLFSMTNIALVVGGGFAGTIGGFVNKVAPTLVGNTAQAVAGGALYYFTKGFFKNVGLGVLVKTAGDLVEDQVVPRITGAVGGSSGW